jgi:hypothetical protein
MGDFFRFRGPLRPGDQGDKRAMVWREDLIGLLLDDIEKVNYPVLCGPHQIGKTTAARQLICRILQRPCHDWAPVYFDCSLLAGQSSGTVAGRLERAILVALAEYAEVLRKDDPKVVFSPPKSDLSLDFDRLQTILDESSKQLPQLARLVLIVDEIECLAKPDMQCFYETLSGFRGLHHEYPRGTSGFACCVVLCSSRDLGLLAPGPGSPYNTATTRPVTELTEKDWGERLDERAKADPPVQFTPAARARLHREVGGHPYLLQRLSDLAEEAALYGSSTVVEESHVLTAVLALLEKGDQNLEMLAKAVDEGPERQDLVRRLLRGHLIAYERILEAQAELSEIGLLVDRERQLCFRNRLYARVNLARQYEHLDPPTGTYVREYGQLMCGISEIQCVVVNDDLRKEVLAEFLKANTWDPETLISVCEKSIGNTQNLAVRDLDTGFIKAAMEYSLSTSVGGLSEVKRRSLMVISLLLTEVVLRSLPAASPEAAAGGRAPTPPPDEGDERYRAAVASPEEKARRRAYGWILYFAAGVTAACALWAFLAALFVLWRSAAAILDYLLYDDAPAIQIVGDKLTFSPYLVNVPLGMLVSTIVLALYGFILLDFTKFVLGSIQRPDASAEDEQKASERGVDAVFRLVLQAFLLSLIGLIPCLEGYRPWSVPEHHSPLYALLGLPALVLLLVVLYGVIRLLRKCYPD